MSAVVPHFRPELSDAIRSGVPVGASDWSTLGGLSNWCQGHGGMLIPWSAIGYTIDAEAYETLRFYVAPKLPCVERIWAVNLRGASPGVIATITAGSASAVTVPVVSSAADQTPVLIREPLSAKTEAAGAVELTVAATDLGVSDQVIVESVALYEQTRSRLALDSTDYGVDLSTLRPRDPIGALSNRSTAGVMAAYKALDARRAGYFHWAAPDGDPIVITSGTPTALFPLDPPCIAPTVYAGDAQSSLTIAVRASASGGQGVVAVSSSADADTIAVVGAAAWYTVQIAFDAEDLAAVDGRRSSAWESVTLEAYVDTATSISISSVSVIGATKPL